MGARARIRRVEVRRGVGIGALVVGLVALLVVAGAAWWLLRPKGVAMVAVQRGTIVRAFYATGVVRPDYEYVVKSKAQGALLGFEKREGARVKKGEVIARVDDRQLAFEVEKTRAELEETRKQLGEEAPQRKEILAKLNEAKEQLDISQRMLDRTQSSYEKQAATISDLDLERRTRVQWSNTVAALESQLGTLKIENQRAFDVATANLRKAEANLADATVVAPIDGIILERYVENQEVVGVNQQLVLMAAADDLLMKAAVDEEDVTRAKIGQTVDMQLYAFQNRDGVGSATGGEPTILKGKVVEILPSANAANKTYEVKVRFDEKPAGLRVGMTGELNFIESETAQAAALVVPSSAVLDGKVYRREAGGYAAVAVKTGTRTLEKVQIVEGVEAGEEIVADAKQVAPVKLPPAKQPVVPVRTGDVAEQQ